MRQGVPRATPQRPQTGTDDSTFSKSLCQCPMYSAPAATEAEIGATATRETRVKTPSEGKGRWGSTTLTEEAGAAKVDEVKEDEGQGDTVRRPVGVLEFAADDGRHPRLLLVVVVMVVVVVVVLRLRVGMMRGVWATVRRCRCTHG